MCDTMAAARAFAAECWAISNSIALTADFESSSATLLAEASRAGLHEAGTAFDFKRVFEDEARSASGLT
jgi:hypothetical protein